MLRCSPMPTATTHNAGYFAFLRKRADFVIGSLPSDAIEGYLVWGAAVDALARIHARRTAQKLKPNRTCFTRAIDELLPHLRRVSVPLLAHDLVQPGVPASTAIVREIEAYRGAAAHSRIWSWNEDPLLDRVLADVGTDANLSTLVRRNSYSQLLYEEYRCCAVHGLELGHKTFCSPEVRGAPGYMNYRYDDNDPRSREERPRTRLCFPLDFLAEALREAIDTEEHECATASFSIPAYPTLDD